MPFIPLHADRPKILIEQPWVTYGLIAACGFMFLWQNSEDQFHAERLILGLGAIPAVISGHADLLPELVMLPAYGTLISYQFLHGDLLHLAFNMAYLWVFGGNVEDAMGHGRFLAFYLLCGIAAALAHVALDFEAAIPLIGASGAISGVLGAYLLLHPKAKVLVPIIVIPFYLPAYVLLLFWLGFQFYSAFVGGDSATAWWAHIGGFLAGAILVVPFRHKTLPLWDCNPMPTGMRIRSHAERAEHKDSDR